MTWKTILRANRAWILFALLLFALAAAVPTRSQTSNQVSLDGTLTSEGVECPTMRTADDKLYSLALRTPQNAFFPGDKIHVEGTIAQVSICQQGTTIEVEKLTPAE